MSDLFERPILTVSQLTGQIRDLLETTLGSVWLAGEISNLRRPSSGHMYLTLKDEGAQIRAVMFRTKQRYLGFDPDDGQEVLVRGRLSVYEPRGEYQVVVDYMEPRGEGALRLAFERLKNKLAAEGLFDPGRKKKPPFLPRRVAVVTSPTGAAVRDFIRTARRRFDRCWIGVYPVKVQGEGAAAEIAAAVETLNRAGGFDLIVLTRGGGSLEDLWPFNEEVVARAVAGSDLPVVSAVGHEVDWTISDLVADERAATPTAAAQLVFRDRAELTAYVRHLGRRLTGAVKGRFDLRRERLRHLATRLGRPERALADRRLRLDDLNERLWLTARRSLEQRQRRLERAAGRLASQRPDQRLKYHRGRLDDLDRRLTRSGRQRLAAKRDHARRLAGRLEALSPLKVLDRGYAAALKLPERAPLKTAASAAPGDRIEIVLARGRLETEVTTVIDPGTPAAPGPRNHE